MTTDGDRRLREAEEALSAARAQDDALALARALLQHARALRDADRRREALSDLDELIERFPAGDDLELRGRLAEALWRRAHWSKRGDAATLRAMREIVAVCEHQPADELRRRTLVALERQATLESRLGDVSAAIATRRRIVAECRDVRVRERPDRVYAQWYLLASDLCDDGQPQAGAATARELVTALESADVSAPDERIADALRLELLALWNLDRRADGLALCADLQRRFAASPDPQARLAATDALVALMKRHLWEHDVRAAISIASDVATRLQAETEDEDLIAALGEELETVADWMAWPTRPLWLSILGGFASRSACARTFTSRQRPRQLRQLADEIGRLDCAAWTNELLLRRFAGATGRRRHGLEVRAHLRSGLLGGRAGRFGVCVRALEAYQAAGPEAVRAALSDVRRYSSSSYPLVIWAAAMMGASVPLGPGDDADQIRAVIRRILTSTRGGWPCAWAQLRTMDRGAR